VKVFHCDHCEALVFFENVRCVNCDHALAYLPDLQVIGSLTEAGDNLWTSPQQRGKGRKYRLCENYVKHNVCNWAVPADDANPLCRSCRLTRVIPDLGKPGNQEAWYKLEAAKRRLVYSLLRLRCPLKSKAEDPEHGLAFEFLADPETPGAPRVTTGHAGGLITLNVTEAHDAEREKRRVELHEPYRTLLGHFRHEVGHYYWERLVQGSPRIERFRELFGDEREDYGQALKEHYRNGPPADWQQRFVERFDKVIADWFSLTYVLNNLSRSLGQPDAYPFVLSAPAIEKLRFVHQTIATATP
jgi:hypothetical protein